MNDMSIRKIKDAKDLSDNSLIYFKGHAKATYMSDGSTVEDNINQLKNNSDSDNNIDLSDYYTKDLIDNKNYSTISYVDTKITNLVNGVPDTLNTLDELAEALKDNKDIITILENSISNKADKSILSNVATSGSYNDLTNKPTIPNAVTESTVSSWGFTKNNGTYNKPSTGIPKTDLASAVQTSLKKADTALQTETYKGTITGVSANGTSIATSGVANIPAASISAYGVTKLSSATNSTSTSLAATASAVKAAYDLANVKQDKLVSGTNIKTINGTSILGSGDIVISSGGSSSGNGAYALVEHDTNDTTFTLTPNTFHVWGEVGSLTLTFGSETPGIANEYLFQFTSGATATTLSLPSDLKWANDSAPTIESNMIYQVSILKGLASVLEFSNAAPVVIITFYYSGSSYSAEEGMTWEQWCDSKYNGTLLKINGGTLTVNGLYPVYNSSGMLVYGTDVIIENEYYNYQSGSGGGA